MPKRLSFVPKTDPILRETLSPISDFNDPLLQQSIEDMLYSIQPEQLKKAKAAHASAAGMAANQWGLRFRVFIFSPHGCEDKNKLEVMLNPSYVPINDNNGQSPTTIAYEGCFSIPLTTGIIQRFESIEATYWTREGKEVKRILHGWEARVFQHETDHLDGKLFDGTLDNYSGPDCLERIVFKSRNEMQSFWNKKSDPE